MITEAWLRSIGFLPDGEGNSEFAVSMDNPMAGEHNQLIICLSNMSVGIECFDDRGNSLDIISLGYRATKEQIILLCIALGCYTTFNDVRIDFSEKDTVRKDVQS